MDFREFSEAYNEQVLQHSWGVAVTESRKSQAAQEYDRAVQACTNCLTAAYSQLKQAQAEFNKMNRTEKNGNPFSMTGAYGNQAKGDRIVQLYNQVKNMVNNQLFRI